MIELVDMQDLCDIVSVKVLKAGEKDMSQMASKGNCYLCGRLISKSAFKKHILNAHFHEDEGQDCIVLKVEDTDSKMYWLYLDISATSTLKTLDTFLRKIWLECCGHMSAFYDPCYGEISMSRKIADYPVGFSFLYEYDFGDTTQLKITIVAHAKRPKQRTAIRLLGRNEVYHFACQNCGKYADYICVECLWEDRNPFLCEACVEDHEHGEEPLLPVVNSPRMGVCGYCGELDEFDFNPEKFVKV